MPIKIEILRQGRLVLFTYPGTLRWTRLTSMNDALQRDILSKLLNDLYDRRCISPTRAPTNILYS